VISFSSYFFLLALMHICLLISSVLNEQKIAKDMPLKPWVTKTFDKEVKGGWGFSKAIPLASLQKFLLKGSNLHLKCYLEILSVCCDTVYMERPISIIPKYDTLTADFLSLLNLSERDGDVTLVVTDATDKSVTNMYAHRLILSGMNKNTILHLLASSPCVISLRHLLASSPCVISLHHLLASSPCIISLHHLLASSHCIISLHNLLVSSPCTISLYHLLVSSPCIIGDVPGTLGTNSSLRGRPLYHRGPTRP